MAKRKIIKKSNKPFTYNSNYYSWGGDFKKALGETKPFNLKDTFSGGNVAGMLKRGLASGIGSTIGNIGGSLIGGGLESGAGKAIGTIGSTIGGVVGTVNPVLGGIISAGSGILGGVTNALFGSKLNQEKINEIEGSNRGMNTLMVDNSSTDSIMNQWANQDFGSTFSKSDIGKDGLFSNKAKNKYNELLKQQDIAINRALTSYENAADAADMTTDLNAMANFAAYGGPLNLFEDGGGIHIKPSKRGTFTAAAKKHGKSVLAFASLVLANKENYSPAMVKKANFARNASKWKHGDGGPISSNKDTIIPMIAETALDFTPIIGDVKGLTYDVYQGYKDEGLKGAAVNTGLGLLGLVPFAGDAIKASVKVGKKANKLAKIVNEVVDYSKLTDKEWDDLYNKALKSGDKMELQRLRDAHFRVKAPNTKIVDNEGNIKPVYRGDKESHNVLRESHIDSEVGDMQGIYTTFDKKYAKQYGDINSYYVNSENPLYTKGRWTGIINEQAKDDILDNGYDLVINENFDNTPRILDPFIKKRTENILFDNTKIKSTNPVTYDDTGNIIPLSKRDNFNSSDIRYGLIPIGLGGLGLSTLDSNQKASGGSLFTNGTEWSNGVTMIDNGDTHEYLEGQEYDVTEEEIKLLKKLGYEFEYL